MANIRPLSTNLAKYAATEINEDPKRLIKDLEYLKEWLSKQPHLKVRMDDQWLVAFLRGCKHSLERTKEKLDTFYTLKGLIPELFRNQDPSTGKLRDMVHSCTIMAIEDPLDSTRPLIHYYRQHFDTKQLDLITMYKYWLIAGDIFLYEYDTMNVNGVITILDMELVTMGHITQATPSLLKKCTTILETAYPTRVKEFHFINSSPMFEKSINLLKMFCSPKLASRIQVHKDSASLFKFVPKRLLPSDIGGEGDSWADAEKKMAKKVEEYREWILEDENYGTDETLRPGKAKTTESFFGIEGSFRQLTVD